MAKIQKIRTVRDFSELMGHKDTHPLVSVIEYGALPPVPLTMNDYSVYGIFCHDKAELQLGYGCGKYDYNEGTLICVAPGQIGGAIDTGEFVQLTGWSLMFHPDLLRGTQLARRIKDYSFFDYTTNEALHMTAEEHDILSNLMRLLQKELATQSDKSQTSIIITYIELILNYCQRFYDRQFMTRKLENNDTLKRFEAELKSYFDAGLQRTKGVPGIKFFADRLCMSSNYLGDVIKKVTGDTAGNLIRRFVINNAKNLLAANVSVSQAAYECGFDYPQHFTRMFKQLTGQTPSQYKHSRR